MINALNINSTVGIFFEDWVEISEGMTLEYEVSLYEDADLDKVRFHRVFARLNLSRTSARTRDDADLVGYAGALAGRFILRRSRCS